MLRVPERLRHQVRDRAQGWCEYCLIHEDDVMYSHEADHIVAESMAGKRHWKISIEVLVLYSFYIRLFASSTKMCYARRQKALLEKAL